MKSKNAVKNVAVLGVFAAVIVVLQLLSYSVKVGPFNLSFVLVPIVLGAVLYGPKTGALLGAIFGVAVVVCCFTGLDVGGYILITANPWLTSLICIVKGALAGLSAGLVAHSPLRKSKPYLAAVLAAAIAPVVNTTVFCAATLLFFKDILVSWAGGTDLMVYVITGLIGINFIIEFAVNCIFAPALFRVSKAIKKI